MSIGSKVSLRRTPVSARKMRLVADMIRGKSVLSSLMTLGSQPLKCNQLMYKLLLSALSNIDRMHVSKGENNVESVDMRSMVVSEVYVDEGGFYKRSVPCSRGRSSQTRTRCCHVVLKVYKDK
ncbi:MAG: large ribosomal subunit protein uL22 [Phocaeicola sp.]